MITKRFTALGRPGPCVAPTHGRRRMNELNRLTQDWTDGLPTPTVGLILSSGELCPSTGIHGNRRRHLCRPMPTVLGKTRHGLAFSSAIDCQMPTYAA
jgi:hypothetical protein